MADAHLSLRVLAGEVAVWRADAQTNAGSIGQLEGPLTATIRTAGELSGVCAVESVPTVASNVQGPWTVLEVAGPLEFSLTGVLASIAVPLAEAGVSIFAVSTFDTDYVLVPSEDADRGVAALRSAGHDVI
jgi:hypothetical protein